MGHVQEKFNYIALEIEILDGAHCWEQLTLLSFPSLLETNCNLPFPTSSYTFRRSIQAFQRLFLNLANVSVILHMAAASIYPTPLQE